MQQQISCDTLITASVVLAQDAERHIWENGAVAVKNGRISAVGPRDELAAFTARESLHLGKVLLMPGLINAHTHVSMTFLRGLADDLPLMEWLNGYIFPKERHLTAEIVRLGALLGCAEMIRTGTTAFSDMYLIEEAVAGAVEACGLRCQIGEGIFAFPSPAYAEVEEGFSLAREQAAKYAGHPRIRAAVMPHTVYTTTREILAASRDLARELGLPLYMHLAETRAETETCLKEHGKRPLAYCAELGLLGPSFTIAHGVDLGEEELDMLAETGTHVVHCPKSNMKLSSGVAPVPGMLARGMLPGLGTDGAASNNSLNMFSEMSACSLLHKAHSQDPTACPAGAVLDMATLGGARAIGWPELGRLAPGAPADLVALDLSSPNFLPMYAPVSHLVYAASGHEVCFSMVDGRVLYQHGKYMSLDYPALVDEAAKLEKWVRDKQ